MGASETVVEANMEANVLAPDIARILYIVSEFSEIRGTKKIQKLVWYAKRGNEKGHVRFSYKFDSPHIWKPHDFLLDDDIDSSCKIGLLDYKYAIHEGKPPSHIFYVTDKTKYLFNEIGISKLLSPEEIATIELLKKTYLGMTDTKITEKALIEYNKEQELL